MKFSRITLAAAAMFAFAGAAFALNNGPADKSPGGTALGSASLWVVVEADGTVTRGDGNALVTKSGTGVYQARFRRNIRNCVYVASVGLGGSVGTSPAGTVQVVGENASVTGVFITTNDLAGTSADRGFHLLVTC